MMDRLPLLFIEILRRGKNLSSSISIYKEFFATFFACIPKTFLGGNSKALTEKSSFKKSRTIV